MRPARSLRPQIVTLVTLKILNHKTERRQPTPMAGKYRYRNTVAQAA
jgi:hypothetical protein